MFSHTATRGDVFWQPFSYAIAFFIVFTLLGLTAGSAEDALLIGMSMAAFAYVVGFVTWLSILRESYHPQPEPEPVSNEIPDGETWWYTFCEDRVTQHILRDLPVTPWQLSEYAQGLAWNTPPTYENWVGSSKTFREHEYRALCDWLQAWGYATSEGYRQPIQFTAKGRDILGDIQARGIHSLSPAETMKGGQI